MQTNQYTFWKLIGECSIEIPTIQRDYTYGRKKAKDISSKLISSILDVATSEDKVLHLDFVYGKRLGVENFKALERNKTSINTLLQSIKNYAEQLNLQIEFNTNQKSTQVTDLVTFIPLDGQQRLTTLFLIHWYIVNHIQSNSAKTTLNRFNYATRISSKEFLRMICNPNNYFDIENHKDISKAIENHEAFFTTWKKDPTVASMLSVLKEIQKQFLERNLIAHDFWRLLTDESKITFDFFDLDDFELTDELYLKMNARGKKLTDFENFKAWLIKNNIKNISINNWKTKLDLDWNDVFWKEREKSQSKIDTSYLQYFKNMFLGDYLLQNQSVINEKDEIVDLLRLNNEFNPISTFESSIIFKENIENYLNLLEYFSSQKITCKLNNTFFDNNQRNINKLLFHTNHDLTWWHTTFYYSVTRYIIASKGNITYLNQWLRVISNLIYNTPIESPKLYREACESINNLIEIFEDKDIYVLLKDLDENKIDFFSEKQKAEEIKKAKLIAENPESNWLDLFISLENHPYFYGQIGFIFDLIDNENYIDFSEVSEKVSVLFSEDVMKDSSYLLFRALLTIEDCFIKNGDTLTYPSNLRGTLRNRNENWRRFFENKIIELKTFIFSYSITQSNVISILNDVIHKHKDDGIYTSKFIKNQALLTYPQNNHIRRYDMGYYLLSKTRIYSFFTELYTYDWYLNNEEFCKKNNLNYKRGKGEDSEAGIISKNNEDEILHFNHKNGKYVLSTNKEFEYNSIDEAIKKIID